MVHKEPTTFLSDEIRPSVFQHMRDNAKKKDIFLDFINGYREHVHCLISLGVTQTIADTVRLIKGESSHWINQNSLVQGKFEWQHEYFAVGVCESLLDVTRNYIRNQEDHHSRKGFDEEFDLMLEKYGFERFEDS